MKPVRAGRLRHRVSIEELVTTQDTDGATVEDWIPAFDHLMPAEITPVSGREFLAAQAAQSAVATRIKVRYHPRIQATTMRVRHRDTLYNIEAVLPDADSGIRYLTLLCTAGVSQGE